MATRRQENIHRKMQVQKSQIRSILSDFRKAKHKCIALCEQINVEFKQRPVYEAMQKQVQLKCQLLDVSGLVLLKNRLVKSLSELFDIENELNTQKQRLAARKQFNKFMSSNSNSNRVRRKDSKNITMQDIKNKTNQFQQQNKIQKHDQNSATRPQPVKATGFNVPLYRVQDDSAENKVERISKYVASLKSTQQKEVGNMKMHAEDKPNERIKQLLHEDPEFIAMKEELQKYKAKQEELEAKIRILQKRADQKNTVQKEKYDQLIEETDTYRIVKIYKVSTQNSKRKQKTPPKLKPTQQASPAQDSPSINPRKLKIAQLHQQIEQLKSKRKDAQILQIEKQLQKQQYNVESVVSRINSTLQNNEQKLRRLREQRIKIFEKDQDVWAQLEQI